MAEEIDASEVGGRGGSLARPRASRGSCAWGVEGPLGRACALRWRGARDLENLLPDGHGSTRLVTDPDGDVTHDPYNQQDQRFTYDAYGNLLETPDYRVTMFLYAGEQYSAATGLYYLRARYYDPSTGRFTALDPAAGSPQDPISLHKYLYAAANPVMNTDPTGMCFFSLGDLNFSLSLQNLLSSIRTFGYAKTVKWATNAIVSAMVGFDWYQGISSGATLDAYCVGVSGTYNIPKLELGPTLGVDFVIGAHTHRVVMYGFLGATTGNSGGGGYVGLAFNTRTAADYRGFARSVTITPSSLPRRAKDWIVKQLTTFLPRLRDAFAARQCDLGQIARSIDPGLVGKASQMIVSALSKGVDQLSSITLWGGSGTAFGFTVNPTIVSWGSSVFFSSAVGYYFPVIPSDVQDIEF